jgi:dihydroorotase
VEYALAANGISGIETAFSLAYTYLVKPGHIDMKRLIELMSLTPSELLGIKAGLLEGNPADLTVVDLNEKYIIDSSKFVSKGKNTPFNGYEVSGAVKYTLVGGVVKVSEGKVL